MKTSVGVVSSLDAPLVRLPVLVGTLSVTLTKVGVAGAVRSIVMGSETVLLSESVMASVRNPCGSCEVSTLQTPVVA